MAETDPAWDEIHEKYSRKGLIDHNAPVQADGEIDIAAPPERVWAALTHVAGWHHIRADISDVTMHGSVATNSPFTWSTQGLGLSSRFGLVSPVSEVAWSTSTRGLVMSAHYELERRGDGNTLLKGHEAFTAPMFPQLGNDELRANIRSWLEGVKAVAERAGPSHT
ncbi:MAG: hypothetical protein JWR51_514 [Devosia sp.]|uniref:SRPBCC family protein n=1 Tax=Devosia sp. TaxID=1871048 RepID=UPI00260602C6|nr:SRPBCC family protein [Devosia sp.]MDB5527411.1 hypothetical protein [Devosia sp.]